MAATKHILVLGATGASGLEFIKAALEDASKPYLTLLVRTTSKLPSEYASNPQITIVQGQLSDPKTVNRAMQGVTSVVSFLGAYIKLSAFLTRSTQTPIADSFQNVFDAMRDIGVKRIMALSTPGAFPQPNESINWIWWLLVFFMPKFVTPDGNAEMRKMGELVSAQNNLDWTVFRVPHLNKGSADLPVETGFLGPNFKGSWELSRPSLVRWVLRELDEKEWVGKSPAVGNPWAK